MAAQLNIGQAFSGLHLGTLFKNVILGLVVMVLVGGVIIWFYVKGREKLTYKTPVSLLIKLDNGVHKRRDDLKGGLIKQRNGVLDFVIKVPKQMKKKKLGFVPDFSKADGNGRILFIQIGDGMAWQQCQEKLITEKEIEMDVPNENGDGNEKRSLSYNLLIEPIPTDIKTITINNIHSIENLMEANRFKAATIAIGAFVLMAFVQIIFLFLTSKK